MKHPLKSLFAIVFFVGSISTLPAQFSISAQLRPRMEYRDGFRYPKSANSEAAFFVSQRTRLNFAFQNEKIKLFLSPQDVRVWGSENQLANDASFGLHEAWGQVMLSDKFSVKTGRQELAYDGDRLLGNVDWIQPARSHDALLLRYESKGLKVDAAGAFNQSSENIFTTHYRLDNYKVLTFLHAEKKSETLAWSGVVIGDAFEKSDSVHDLAWRYTLGTLLNYKKGNLSLEGSAHWQGGKTQTDRDIAAYLLTAKATYQLNKIALTAGFDWVSGDDSNDEDFQAFNTLYGTNHKFYGLIDYFLNVPADTDGGGLQDYYINVSANTGSKSSLQFTYHQFFLANDVPDASRPGELLNHNLGGELDAGFTYKLAAYANFQTGLSLYFPNATTQQIKGGSKDELNTSAWLMLTLNPTLFTSSDRD
ncbi:MAG: alginate export family protein [Saprospiraceae bacterium]|nr:alginate export family protein [Saprospiraceae bacterium]MCF8248997.1 alginate export family protein [Saprospiraceae bacterium]MCF8279208.1 alginate export family protein [Bacteroidales bacterium]MCF8310891.1 alginate export family protein [Saprospiraceae bacterium]MCF8439521.1 alginate export family protein [Saprospiraceae bacterium]